MNTTSTQINKFLEDFKQKMQIWDVLFRDDRGKNAQALADLELRPVDRKRILQELTISDYSDGPKEEKLYGNPEMWVFGKIVNTKEVYIKITMGLPGNSVICISFHVAENKMSFPFKNIQL